MDISDLPENSVPATVKSRSMQRLIQDSMVLVALPPNPWVKIRPLALSLKS